VIDRKIGTAVGIAVGVVVLDHVTKYVVERTMTLYETIPLLPFFSLTYVRNTGAAFGLLGDLPAMIRLPLFVGVAVFAIVALASYLREVRTDETAVVVALGGVLGGAFGNLIDRVRYGEVVDFLHLHYRGAPGPPVLHPRGQSLRPRAGLPHGLQWARQPAADSLRPRPRRHSSLCHRLRRAPGPARGPSRRVSQGNRQSQGNPRSSL
jgi:signal peptidase II